NARLGADAVRYSFIAVDFHHLLFAGLFRRTEILDFRTKPDGRTKQNIPLENCGLVRIQVGELHHLVHDLANANSVAQLLVDEPLIDWFWLSVRPSLSRNRRNTPSSVDEVGLRPSRSP